VNLYWNECDFTMCRQRLVFHKNDNLFVATDMCVCVCGVNCVLLLDYVKYNQQHENNNVFASSSNGVGLHVSKLCGSEVPNVQRSS
jgi:hypothetical protein